MAVEGTLDLFKLPEILQLVAQQKKTGILTVQGQQDIVAISFLAGRIVAADALNQSMEEGLARVLVGEGILGASELARASSEHQAAGGRLIDLLVERGYVDRPRLLEALRLQTRRLVEGLLRWDEGDFKFYGGEEVSYEEGFAPISVEDLLLRAAAAEADAAQGRAAAVPAGSIRPPATAGSAHPPASAGSSRSPAAPPALAPMPTLPNLSQLAAAAPGAGVGPTGAPARPTPFPAAATRSPAAPSASAPAPAATLPFRKMTVEKAAVPVSQRRLGWLLALVPVAILAVVATTVPDLVILPFPWQEPQRRSFAQEQRSALFLKIDRAAKTFYQVEGRFPDRLTQLVAAGLLAPADLRDPGGQPLGYRSDAIESYYTVQPLDDRLADLPGADAKEAITGNFLLDPEVTAGSPDAAVPLVLLD